MRHAKAVRAGFGTDCHPEIKLACRINAKGAAGFYLLKLTSGEKKRRFIK